jgi:hypothetical protein
MPSFSGLGAQDGLDRRAAVRIVTVLTTSAES